MYRSRQFAVFRASFKVFITLIFIGFKSNGIIKANPFPLFDYKDESYNMRLISIGITIMVLTILTQCGQRRFVPIDERSFYYWKTTFSLDSIENDLLRRYKIQKLYVRYFDVDVVRESEIVPTAPIRFLEIPTQDVVPVVFITNRTISALQTDSIPHLAEKIISKIQQLHESLPKPIQEIQMDCDWSRSTRVAYFSLLEHIKQRLPDSVVLSATIRLHQVKFTEITGIPPVDKGLLMVYNIANVTDFNVENSIFDPKIIEKYTEKLRYYPLHLDIAFPIFKQEVIFRNEKFVKTLRQANYFDINVVDQFSRLGFSNRYRCIRDTFFNNTPFLAGDIVRVERSLVKEVHEVTAHMLERLSNTNKTTFIYFDLNSSNFNNTDHETPIFPSY